MSSYIRDKDFKCFLYCTYDKRWFVIPSEINIHLYACSLLYLCEAIPGLFETCPVRIHVNALVVFGVSVAANVLVLVLLHSEPQLPTQSSRDQRRLRR